MQESVQRKGALRVGSLFGIPFFVDASWFLILALVTWSYGSSLAAQHPEWEALTPWITGFVSALFLFGSVVLHELGHSLTAMAQGIRVQSISLFLFGGVAQIERESRSPWGALAVALAGPLVSLALFGVFFGLGQVLPLDGPIAAVVSLLASVNLALAVFNLLPGLPLDGGNVLKAIVWGVTGNQYKGVRVAGLTGQVVGVLMILAGLLAFGNFSGLWFAVIGWFVFSNARRYSDYARVQERLSAFTAAQAAVYSEPVPAGTTLRTFADLYAVSSQQRSFLVTDFSGRLVGHVDRSVLLAHPVEQWPYIPVASVLQPIDASETVASSEPLDAVLVRLEQKRLSRLAVLQANGLLVGQVRIEDIRRLFDHPQRWRLAG
ncbi:site-2 protease family protein [Gloeobacter kilaueensis]|uniref:Zinc metalloprotease n=1 Tax=Gloeobacter kilaueensis (strain ATCC BAA-2537 / CCAP 1431/1 / ULC 316 / JS1) TaxID=1183438 RepID=U5QJH0_GLOK1|nr:site-2 protease family protein [Gloeobacter kilaueensis]AGY59023.1 peptidase M50 [Gloeobacter kilaueensis JS1]